MRATAADDRWRSSRVVTPISVSQDSGARCLIPSSSQALELGNMLDVAEAVATAAIKAPRVARCPRANATTRVAKRRRAFSITSVVRFSASGAQRSITQPGSRDYPLATGGAQVLMSVEKKTSLVFRVTALRSRSRRSDRFWHRATRSRCQPDWKVLDALNYIKDEIDPTLSHRWSCRMARVRELRDERQRSRPKLTCKTALVREYSVTHVERRAAFELPHRPRSGHRDGRFYGEV